MRFFSLIVTALALSSSARALEIGSFRLEGRAAAGYNNVQGAYGLFGVDLYTMLDDNLAAGVGGYYSAGKYPSRDRQIGVGPFVSYAYPVVEFFALSARQDVTYVDSRTPVTDAGPPEVKTYESDYGVGSITSLAAHLYLTQNFVVSAGYRIALSLNSSDLMHGRSGFIFGVAFGI